MMPNAMKPFVLTGNPARIVFGNGTIATLPDEVARLGATRALVLATPQQEQEAVALAQRLGERAAGVFSGAAMHTPVSVTEQALEQVRSRGADALVAVGGGSTTGLAKALALRTGLPQIVAPTTYAGSEMTPILGETSGGEKKTITDRRVLPQVVIYDVGLTLSLPPALSVVSGFNAIAHAVEALYARDRNPMTSLMALEGTRAIVRALPRIVADPQDLPGRTDMLYGAWLCGTCLGSVGMALHHKLCHVLGGMFGLPHAETHTAVLPHALAYNAPSEPETVRALADILGHPDPALALWTLARRLGATMSLIELGMPEGSVDDAARAALANPYWNPRPLEPEPLRRLLQRAAMGAAPESSG